MLPLFTALSVCSVVEEERELTASLEQCIGHIGKCLDRDIQRSVHTHTQSCKPRGNSTSVGHTPQDLLFAVPLPS